MPGRTAILVVNGFDRSGRWGTFDAGDAIRYPWIDLCLREVVRRSKGADHDVLVWDNTHSPELRAIVRRHGARLFPTDEDIAASDASGLVLNHGGSLQRLLELVDERFDYVMTLDTDAFPVRDGWIEELKVLLEDASLAGVWRDEMPSRLEPFVHPSCLFMRRERLLQVNEAFSFAGAQDVGQRITKEVRNAGDAIAPLRRSNARNAHFVMGGIYGDLVYHHGAGSRFPVFRMTEGEERELAIHARLRDAAFADVDHLVAVLRGQDDDDLGLEWEPVAAAVTVRRPFPGRAGGSSPARTSGWLDELPGQLSVQASILRSLLDAVEPDERYRAMQVQGSIGRGTGDRLSDVDVGFVVADASWPEICREVPALLHRTGSVIDEYYDFVPSADTPELFKAWASFADGIQMDVMLMPGRQTLGSGPDGRNLLDRDGRLVRTDHPVRLAEPQEIVKWAFLAWQNLTEVAKYLERERAVAAAEWLNSARQATISCWAAAHGVEYAGFANVAAARLGVSVPMPAALEQTYAGPDLDAVLSAAIALAEVQARADGMLAMQLGLPRRPLGPWVQENLTSLRARRRAAGSPPARSNGRERRRPAASPRPPRPAGRRPR